MKKKVFLLSLLLTKTAMACISYGSGKNICLQNTVYIVENSNLITKASVIGLNDQTREALLQNFYSDRNIFPKLLNQLFIHGPTCVKTFCNGDQVIMKSNSNIHLVVGISYYHKNSLIIQNINDGNLYNVNPKSVYISNYNSEISSDERDYSIKLGL